MSSFFRGRVGWLPNRFNYVAHRLCVGVYDAPSGLYRFGPPGDAGSVEAGSVDALVQSHLEGSGGPAVGVVHFSGTPKPWNCEPGHDLLRCHKTFRGHADWWARVSNHSRIGALHSAWWAAAAKCPRGSNSSAESVASRALAPE